MEMIGQCDEEISKETASDFKDQPAIQPTDIANNNMNLMFGQNCSIPEVALTRSGITKRNLKNEFKRKESCDLMKESFLDNDINSLHRSMSFVFRIAQCFGLCPVQGISSYRAEDLRFEWTSLRVMYSIIVMTSFMICIGFVFSWLIIVGFSFKTSGALVYYLTGLLCSGLFLKLATKWPELAVLWQKTEVSQKRYGYPRNLSKRIKVMTITVLILAFVEFGLSNANMFYLASYCSTGGMDFLKRYLILYHRHMFEVVNYNHALAIFTTLCSVIGSFYWSFADLFVMLISVSLARRFRLLNNHLKQITGKVMTEGFWRGAREDYNALSYLTTTVDSCVSSIVLLCFATNLFYVCQQMLNSLAPPRDVVQMVYLYVSFSYLLSRTVAMAMYAASVYDESKVAKDVLYAVPAQNYQIEVHRFLVQVATGDVALTGLNFFPVTRTVLLTLAGTIVTYEVVLVQFGTTGEDVVSNSTELCFNLTRQIQ